MSAGQPQIARVSSGSQPGRNGRTESGRLAWLDGLRLIAILGVIVVHTAYAFPALGRGWVLGLGAGRYGVDLFFAISGFLFGEIMLGRPMERWRYLCRRGLRVAAVYFSALLLYVVLRPRMPGAGVLAVNLAFLNPWFRPPVDYLVPGGWSICAEMFFYLAGTLCVTFLRSRHGAWICWATGVTVALALSPWSGRLAVADEFSPVMNLPTFLAGVLGWWYRDQAPRRAAGLALVALAGAAVLLPSLGIVPMPPRYVIGAFCALATWGSIRLLNSPLMASLGRLSYAVYAFHFTVIEWALVLVVAALPVGGSVWQAAGLEFALIVGLTFPIAFVVHRYLEAPVAVLLRPRKG